MQALVDSLDFRRDAEGRHRVSLEKRLSSRPSLRLLERG
jgi:serine/threonine-protein kinase RsbW